MRSLFFFALILSSHAGESHFEGPAEFSEAEVAEEIAANEAASSGNSKISGVSYYWSPSGTVLKGAPKKIALEAESIQNALRKSPQLKGLLKNLKVSADGSTLDLTALLKEIQKKFSDRCHNCFSIPLCFYDQKSKTLDSDELQGFLSTDFQSTKVGTVRSTVAGGKSSTTTKKTKELARGDLAPGDIVLIKDNFEAQAPYHSYIWLTPTLALERRGTGSILIRPQEEIIKDYKELAKMERKSFREIQGKKLPAIGNPLVIEYWKKN